MTDKQFDVCINWCKIYAKKTALDIHMLDGAQARENYDDFEATCILSLCRSRDKIDVSNENKLRAYIKLLVKRRGMDHLRKKYKDNRLDILSYDALDGDDLDINSADVFSAQHWISAEADIVDYIAEKIDADAWDEDLKKRTRAA